MSFRDNLQSLRASRGMTQEQLAMLLGVSRQSVTKWEAERSYPEMDKLLALCDIFDCTLDELVKGDLTDRPKASPDGSGTSRLPADACGYDEQQRSFALKVATGTAIIILSSALCVLFSVLAEGDPAFPEALGPIAVLCGVALGLVFLVPAGIEHAAFVKAHPFIEDFYTAADRDDARKMRSRVVVIGCVLVLAGIICVIALADGPWEGFGPVALLVLVAFAVWLFIYGVRMSMRVNVELYNENAGLELEMEDIVRLQTKDSIKESLMDRKRLDQKIGAVCGVIMIAATVVGLLMLFVPIALYGDDIDPVRTTTGWFWLAWAVGGLLCGMVSLLMRAFGKQE